MCYCYENPNYQSRFFFLCLSKLPKIVTTELSLLSDAFTPPDIFDTDFLFHVRFWNVT